nr:AH receptor-interacting protein [Leptinotarsa decemlineata]
MLMAPNKDLIVKKTLYAGKEVIHFKDGTKIHFHFQTRLCNNDKTLLDDSRKMGKGQPLELVLGKKFKLEVWEAILQKMALYEVAQFTVDKSLVIQYPFVAKTLRDLNKPKEQRNTHCCAMTLQNEGIGYNDLNDFLKNPSDLEFTIELVKVEQPDSYEKETWQMAEEEKIDLIPKLREQGNEQYKNKNYKYAADLYAKAVGMLEQLMLKEKPHDTEWNEMDKQKIPILLNYAQCKLNEGDYYAVIEHCTTVLKSDKDNVKAYFRRAKAHAHVWNVDEAKQDFEKVIELDKSLELLVRKELAALDQRVKSKDLEDKEKYSKIFT